MIQKILKRVTLVLVFMAALCIYAFADVGPKPSTVVEFKDGEDREYYVALLADPNHLSGPNYKITGEDTPEIEDTAVWNRFLTYEDPNGLVFIGGVQKLRGNDTYVWDYYPPVRFRVLVYFPDMDTFAAGTEIQETYAFDSYYQVNFSGKTLEPGGTITIPVARKYNVLWQGTAFLLRLAVTIAVECMLAVLFGFTAKRQLLLILVVNIVTQLAMNLLILDESVGIFAFYLLQYALIEVGIILAEGMVYCLALPKLASENQRGKMHPLSYAVVGNAASFLLGYLLSNCFPMVFS